MVPFVNPPLDKESAAIIRKNLALIVVILLAIVFFFVDNNYKLFVGGILFIFLGIAEYILKYKYDPLPMQHISYYTGYLMVFLGIFSLLVFWLLPEKIILFLLIFPFFLLLASIFLITRGKRGWFKIILAILFFPALVLSIIPFLSNFGKLVHEKGIYQFFYVDIFILLLATLVLFLILRDVLKFLKNKFSFFQIFYNKVFVWIYFLIVGIYLYIKIQEGNFTFDALQLLAEKIGPWITILVVLIPFIKKRNNSSPTTFINKY